MKTFLQIIKGLVIIAGIVLVARLWYQDGRREGIAEYGCHNYYSYFAPHVFTQDPPTISINCYHRCESIEYYTWDEYVAEYKKYMRDQ